MQNDNDEIVIPYFLPWSVVGLFVLGGLIAFTMWGCPRYYVWQQGQYGQAELARAQANRMVAVQEAEARKESATLLAEAEVSRAKGVAQANTIIGESLKGNESYLRYLWVNNLESSHNQVIYVPTETGLPILEAGRLNQTLASK